MHMYIFVTLIFSSVVLITILQNQDNNYWKGQIVIKSREQGFVGE